MFYNNLAKPPLAYILFQDQNLGFVIVIPRVHLIFLGDKEHLAQHRLEELI